MVRRIAADGTVSLIGGLVMPFGQVVDGQGSGAQFMTLGPMARAPSGVLYVTDSYGVRRIAADGTVSFVTGSTSAFGFAEGAPGTAKFFSLKGIVVAPSGDLVVSDNTRIRKVDAGGNVSTIAGSGTSGQSDGPASSATFQFLQHLRRDPAVGRGRGRAARDTPRRATDARRRTTRWERAHCWLCSG